MSRKLLSYFLFFFLAFFCNGNFALPWPIEVEMVDDVASRNIGAYKGTTKQAGQTNLGGLGGLELGEEKCQPYNLLGLNTIRPKRLGCFLEGSRRLHTDES